MDSNFDITNTLVADLGLKQSSVEAVLRLLDEKATVPFIARYRKEATGGLDEVQIRTLEERRDYLKELEERRKTVLKTIEEQGKLTDELKARLLAVRTKTALEDLYLPYKPKRRTKATMAREKGLEPLALRILAQPPEGDPVKEAEAFIDEEKGVPSAEDALAEAGHIVVEQVTENPEVRSLLREAMATKGELRSTGVKSRTEGRTKFEDYYDYGEPVSRIPSHRYLAIRRGEGEGILRIRIELDDALLTVRIGRMMGLDKSSPFGPLLEAAVEEAYQKRLKPSIENDVRVELKLKSDQEAVAVFADNLQNLILAAPLGTKAVLGIDPGMRTGSKCASVNETGKFLENITIYPARGKAEKQKARDMLLAFIDKHGPLAIAVGNGTGGRETEALVRSLLKDAGLKEIIVVSVSEAGASVYSASDVAREEFPDLDLTVRGAISIARRLQDPLAELVKIDPKSIGVGQYQHDVHQPLLQRKLHEVVENCVNRVGVELNTASASLLSYVAGLGPSLAKKIVMHREQEGSFPRRRALLKVAGLGPKAFEQAAGFLRVRDSDNPLDRSAVHPERYKLVEKIATDMGISLKDLVGNTEQVGNIDIERYLGDGVGEPTLLDIMEELKKPGRDPRDTFEAPQFREDVNTLEDLREGMTLEGVVTNVTAFGAFVDVGVHQDGLVHISELADHFVKDPRTLVKVGDKISVRVIGVDLERRRISLSGRSGKSSREEQRPARGAAPERPANENHRRMPPGRGRPPRKPPKQVGNNFSNNPFRDLLKKS